MMSEMTTDNMLKVKGCLQLLIITVSKYLPNGITQRYPPLNKDKRTPPSPWSDRMVFDLPTPQRWKAELTFLDG